MIQRIQTVFLLLAAIILVIIAFWGDFFVYYTADGIFHFNGSGITQMTGDDKEVLNHTSIPFSGIFMILAGFAVFVLISFKNLDKQLKYVRLLWGVYVFVLLGMAVWRYFYASGQVSGEVVKHNFSYGFYLLVIGLPMVQMAMTYIAKDKKTIDSIDRIR